MIAEIGGSNEAKVSSVSPAAIAVPVVLILLLVPVLVIVFLGGMYRQSLQLVCIVTYVAYASYVKYSYRKKSGKIVYKIRNCIILCLPD